MRLTDKLRLKLLKILGILEEKSKSWGITDSEFNNELNSLKWSIKRKMK